MRVQIRRAKLLLADLTHDNLGAYWEAGFAEGLGIPVIYLCEETKFEKLGTHFDTNHHTTIKWNLKNPEKALNQLKSTIRETFPTEAIMFDKDNKNADGA
jgi:nucleoside 2-deoxyribosyltransferase